MRKIITAIAISCCSLITMPTNAAEWDSLGWLHRDWTTQSLDKKINYRICLYRHINIGFGGGQIITQVEYSAKAPFAPEFCPTTRWVNW